MTDNIHPRLYKRIHDTRHAPRQETSSVNASVTFSLRTRPYVPVRRITHIDASATTGTQLLTGRMILHLTPWWSMLSGVAFQKNRSTWLRWQGRGWPSPGHHDQCDRQADRRAGSSRDLLHAHPPFCFGRYWSTPTAKQLTGKHKASGGRSRGYWLQ